MITISAKELRENLSDYLQRSAAGEEIEVLYRSRRLVRILPIKQNESLYTGDKVGKRLEALLEDLPSNISPAMRDPARSYKQLRDELHRRDPKYRRYLSAPSKSEDDD